VKKNKKILVAGFLPMLTIAFLAGPAISADTVIILGIVNDHCQIATDNNQVYEIAEGEKGDELIEFVGKKARVTGTVEEDDGSKVIAVTAYEIIDE
jgi:hypothetical protein